ncbi:MAG: NAD(P)-binding domain-containing protein, partial [Frankiales bacterium]|nr:NAD(P)-binding domain-containing protein [Frankiales bacterium]
MTTAELAGRHVPVVIIGAGQAGLSASWHLTQRGVEHVVLDRHQVAHEWRASRWDSFCLVTPNWQCQLPGWPYSGDNPDGFMVKDEIVAYFEGYVASFGPPLHEGVAVTRLTRDGDVVTVATDQGSLTTDHVVVATGGYQVPIVPGYAVDLPNGIEQVHSHDYKSPESLPPGEVLVVGSGQSGAQIAEDLHLAGRTVHLCLGDAPRVARFYRGR